LRGKGKNLKKKYAGDVIGKPWEKWWVEGKKSKTQINLKEKGESEGLFLTEGLKNWTKPLLFAEAQMAQRHLKAVYSAGDQNCGIPRTSQGVRVVPFRQLGVKLGSN